MNLLNWLKRKLGLHIHDYSQWEKHRVDGTIAEHYDRLTGGLVKEHRTTFVWQERKCKTCGWVQQGKLSYHGE